MKKHEVTLEEARDLFIQNGINYPLDVAFDTGFQNEYDNEGNPEAHCILEMQETEARKYVVENTVWHVEDREDGLYLCGNNDISGFGYAEEKIDDFVKKHEVTLHAAFGNTYTAVFPEWEVVEKAIKEADYNEIAKETVKVLPDMQGAKATAYLNLETLEMEYHYFIGNTQLQQTEHLINMYLLAHPEDEGLEVGDFLSEEEIEALPEETEVWEHINNLPDYLERLIEAIQHYAVDRCDDNISFAIDQAWELYQRLELV